ncbi:MAG: HAMP domain-containing histidine kinase [Chloroflexi bacterium]|nr:HAMP domain-containing histidine kinase [Chloroflexota bacterium]
MSIRLRLTLLYSAIVALTVIAFSTFLYVSQSELTLQAIRTTLARQADLSMGGLRRFPGRPEPQQAPPLPPAGATLPGRWTQLRGADGSVLARTADLVDTPLPLSDEGLRAVQSGAAWSEIAHVQEERVLIFSRAVMAESRVTAIVQVAAPITEREQALNNLRLFLLIGSAVVSLAAFAIGWVLAGASLSPIERITRTASAIGTQRDFSRRVRHTGPNDEVGRLAVTFNSMLTELERAYRQMEQTLESQRRFVADASHELRTPLTTVRGNIELLRHEPPLDYAERAEVLADTTSEVERLIRLVNHLLVLARADAGRKLQCAPVDLAPLVDDAGRQARLLDPQRTLACAVPPGMRVLADRDALKQVLLILLDNARTHTPAEAAVELSAAAESGRAVIRVRDSGPGIAPADLPHIFERFYRGDASRSGASTGLGLAIARELTEVQNGTIGVESTPGQGSTFTVTFPLAAA